MTADDLIKDLMKIHPKGFDLSLGRIKNLLEKLGNPQNRIPPAIHVAGTNGKGSTIAICRALLEASSKRVHVHTSPHLVNWQERYRLAGTLVDDATLAGAIARAADANGGKPITVFEILSAVTFILFSEHPADFSLVEVGLGGRFDATNVIADPLCAVITPVALDHKAYLGDTLEEIAFEKAGIIKKGRQVVVGRQEDAARNVIEARAQELGSPARFMGQDFDCDVERGRFIYHDTKGLLDLPVPVLPGIHQLENASLAIAALRYSGIELTQEAAEQAMKTVYWPARMQRLPEGEITAMLPPDTDIWLDGGHNPHAGQAVAATLKNASADVLGKTIMIAGMLDTKEPDGFFKAFKGQVDEVITVPILSSEAGIEPETLADVVRAQGITVSALNSLQEAIEKASSMLSVNPKNKNRQTVIFAGSLYLAGDVLALNKTPPV